MKIMEKIINGTQTTRENEMAKYWLTENRKEEPEVENTVLMWSKSKSKKGPVG